ncbi:amino acid adenylation domain protein [Truncatella angustata]|uniref:Amino acid adenylation domain protein n=1 Tax=Truncatella angustata TaxID=152316 RepID=A0A9P8ZXI1_9PEZI|nr:amino acid adenylation domain protein [Truncatella angustata]KAH6654887.1 amino acid adenylation domain protein [Truncatella angustata]
MALISGPARSPREDHHHLAGDHVAAYPLTHSQEGIWVDYLANRSSTQYNLTLQWNMAHRVEPQVEVDSIVAAIHELTERHSVLRSTIVVLNGKPHIHEHDPNSVVPVIRLLAIPGRNITEQRLHQALHEPFDLEHEFPVRWYIVQQSSGKHIYLVSHHIALDGGALTRLSSELLDFVEGKALALDQLSERFSQAHSVERAWALTTGYENAQATCLDQIMETHPFRWSKTPPHGTHNFRRLEVWKMFSKDELQNWSTRFSTSWFRVAVSLVGLLLHIDTGSPLDGDHALAVSFGGRPQGFEHTVGQFANPLPIKIPVLDHFLAEPGSERNTLASLVTAVSRNISRVKKSERLSLLDIARRWRANSRFGQFNSPQVAVSYAPAFKNECCRLFPVEGTWDLFFVFQDGPRGVELGVIHDPEIFDDKTMNRMRSTYMRLLELSYRQDPVLLNELPSMPTYVTLPSAKAPNNFIAVHDMFRLHAAENPDRMALSCAERHCHMTYGELDNNSTLRAHVLTSHGVSKGSVVILHLHRNFHLLEWILATLKAGGAFVYLDPTLPFDRKQFILRTASEPNSIMVVEDLLAPDAEWTQPFAGTILPHTHAMELSQPSPEPVTKQVDPEDLAYMIFTSGSTGEPKGVMVEHGSFAHFVRSSVPVYKIGHGSCILQLASFNFDASILEWSSALAAGGTLCFADSPQALVGEYLADVIEQNSISFMQITPSALTTIPLNRQLNSLRCISVGAEAVPAHLLETWRERVVMINSYGPTETSIAVAFQKYTKGGPPIEEVSVGRPPDGTEIYICDPSLTRILPYGMEGEVCIGGKSLSRGYCQRADLTETRFAIHPALGTRLYRSGDRGLLTPDGSLVIRGRMDREIKIRGYRIAPEEVEKAIAAADPGVRGSSVQVSPDGFSLLAIVTPDTCLAETIQRGISKILPSHMRPSLILPVPFLPLNYSGKIDHKTIREELESYLTKAKKTRHTPRESRHSQTDSQKLAKRDMEVEEVISKAWQEEIGLSKTPSTDVNFFDLGGHSHLVPRLQKRIISMYPSCNVSVLDLFSHSTIKSQTRLLCQQLHPDSGQISVEESSEADSFVVVREDASVRELCPDSIGWTEDRTIAVIGIAGKFPGADDPDKLYANLCQGISGIRDSTNKRPVPKDCIWVPRAGTLSSIEDFDANFWKLSREEAADIDPQQRLFLTATLQALEDAGVDTLSDTNNNVGIFVGAAANQYHTVTDPVYGDAFQRSNRGIVAPSISARTAYHLNLHGPNVTVNTNCASGTVAMALAVDALRNRRCDVAVVGGVSVQLFDGGYVTQPKNIFSLTGNCRPFEETADGTVPSDAIVSMVLKRTPDAVADGDSAYALVAGVAYNSDGATSKAGYQVPSPKGQSDVIAAAWDNARMSPEQLQYIELHGSGTPIGDALELEGVKLALESIGRKPTGCLVGSNKGSLGNTQHASGLVSLIKICKSIQNGTIPAMVKTGKLNPFIIDASLGLNFAYQPTVVKTEALIGISAAGWGGVNSHMIIQAPPVKLIKKLEHKNSKYALFNETLAAPRKAGLEVFAVPSPIAVDSALDLIIRELQKVIENGHMVKADTDLRSHGLDSVAFVRLSHSIRSIAKGVSLP